VITPKNDLGNAPMRRVNEKLGYERKFESAHLGGPRLEVESGRGF
jgi:hypothetical protein